MADERGGTRFDGRARISPPVTVDNAVRAFRSAGKPEGDLPDFLNEVGGVLERNGNTAEAERAFRLAINAGGTLAYAGLGRLLARQPGKEGDAERALRAAIAAGEQAYSAYQQRQFQLSGAERNNAVRQVTRMVQAATAACNDLGLLLRRQPGREAEAEAAFRAGLAVGDHDAEHHLGDLLMRQPGRAPEAERLLRQASGAGVPGAAASLGTLLASQQGREAEAERILRDAAGAGDTAASLALAGLRDRSEGAQTDAAPEHGPAGEASRAGGVCPACGKGEVVPIVYGAPNALHMQMAAARTIMPGGAMGRLLSGDAPQWHCLGCGHRWRGGLFAGGQGNTPVDAVVISGVRSTMVGIRAEKQYLTERFGLDDTIAGAADGWHQEEQRHFSQGDRNYDLITIRMADGTRRSVWFDISGFFGAWP